MSGPDLSSPHAKNLALMLLALTQFVVVIDASITNVALPSIGKALDISQDSLSWVVNSYTLVFGGFLLLGGRLAATTGSRRLRCGSILDGVSWVRLCHDNTSHSEREVGILKRSILVPQKDLLNQFERSTTTLCEVLRSREAQSAQADKSVRRFEQQPTS